MPKPPIPTHQEMRDHCRVTYGHYSNISRWRLIEQYGAEDTERVNRRAAEVLEAEFFAKSEAEQDVDLDWYIPRYLGELRRPHGKQYSIVREADPDGDHIRWALMGYPVQTWRPSRICSCELKGVGSDLVTRIADTWLHTWRTCPEHTATEQALWDTIQGESSRFSGVLNLIASLLSDTIRDDRTTLAFLSDRLVGTDERVLEVTIAGINANQRNQVAGAADVQFGPGAIVVL